MTQYVNALSDDVVRDIFQHCPRDQYFTGVTSTRIQIVPKLLALRVREYKGERHLPATPERPYATSVCGL
jgi:hypothetical protein